MLSMSDLRPGVVIIWNGQPHQIIWREHTMMGRGGGILRTKMRNLTNGSVIENTFKGNDKVDEADLDRKKAQFLYIDEQNAAFMDTTSYEQFELSKPSLGDQAEWLVEGMEVDILIFNGKPIGVTLPTKVEYEVTYTEPGFKGNTASNTLKPATVSTGAETMVPLFINIGDKIIVDTRDGSYAERGK